MVSPTSEPERVDCNRPTWELIRGYLGSRPNQPEFQDSEFVSWFREHCPSKNESTVRIQLRLCTTNVPTRVHNSPSPKHDILYLVRKGVRRRYDPNSDPSPIYAGNDPRASEPNPETADEAGAAPDRDGGDSQFRYEHHLRDYLARNLAKLGAGLKLVEVEFPIGGRFIDILCKDQEGGFVVVELKVSSGHDRTVGQILYYMGRVRRELANGAHVRGIIVANSISDELRTAVKESKAEIQLCEYEISFQLRRVEDTGSPA